MARKKRVTVNHGGLGTTIQTALQTTGIAKVVDIITDGKDCGCEKRKEKLNNLFPKRYKARCLTEQEYNEWKDFRETRTLKLEWEQVLYVCKLYSEVFSKPYWQPDCPSCGSSTQEMIKMIELIDKVFEIYENN
jgi:hypothetical protein